MALRTVHATSSEWEIARYSNGGRWYIENLRHEAAGVMQVGPEHLGIRTNSKGRAQVTMSQAATLTVGLGLTHHAGVRSGGRYDQLVRKYEAERS